MQRFHVILGVLLAIAGFIFGESLLAGPIIALVALLGFYWGLLVFIVIWAVLGFFAWMLYEAGTEWVQRLLKPANGFREKTVQRISKKRWVGTVVTALLLGPILGVPFWYTLGWRGNQGKLVTVGAAVPFGLLWVSFYGGLFTLSFGGG